MWPNLICVKPIAIVWADSEAILLALKQDPEVAHLAATYLRWAILGLPAYTFNAISRRYFQSQGELRFGCVQAPPASPPTALTVTPQACSPSRRA